MKQILFLILIFFSLKAAAQMDGEPPFKRFSIQAGINYSNMNFNAGEPPPPSPESSAWKTGFDIGITFQIPLAEKLFLQPEYFYVQRNGADNALNTDYALQYLSMPVLVLYQLSPRISLKAGPQVELLIAANSHSGSQTTDITHDVEERSIGATGGVEVNIFQYVFISASYFQGFNHIGIGQRSNTKEFKYQVFNLTAGFRF